MHFKKEHTVEHAYEMLNANIMHEQFKYLLYIPTLKEDFKKLYLHTCRCCSGRGCSVCCRRCR